MSSYKDGFKFGIGFISVVFIAVVLFIVGSVVIEGLVESRRQFTDETNVKLESVQHWIANNQLIFVGTVSYDGNIEWEDIYISFVLEDEKGQFLGRCKDSLIRPFESQSTREFKAECYDIPPNFTFDKYKFEVNGEY